MSAADEVPKQEAAPAVGLFGSLSGQLSGQLQRAVTMVANKGAENQRLEENSVKVEDPEKQDEDADCEIEALTTSSSNLEESGEQRILSPNDQSDKYKKAIEQLKAENAQLKEDASAFENECSECMMDLTSKLTEMKDQLKQRDERIEELESESGATEAQKELPTDAAAVQIEDLRAQIDARDSMITDLEKSLAASKPHPDDASQVVELKAEIDELKTTLQDKTRTVDKLEEQIEVKSLLLEQRDEEIALLQEQLDVCEGKITNLEENHELNAGVNSLLIEKENECADLANEVDYLNDLIEGLEEKLETLEASLGEQGEGVSHASSRPDEVDSIQGDDCGDDSPTIVDEDNKSDHEQERSIKEHDDSDDEENLNTDENANRSQGSQEQSCIGSFSRSLGPEEAEEMNDDVAVNRTREGVHANDYYYGGEEKKMEFGDSHGFDEKTNGLMDLLEEEKAKQAKLMEEKELMSSQLTRQEMEIEGLVSDLASKTSMVEELTKKVQSGIETENEALESKQERIAALEKQLQESSEISAKLKQSEEVYQSLSVEVHSLFCELNGTGANNEAHGEASSQIDALRSVVKSLVSQNDDNKARIEELVNENNAKDDCIQSLEIEVDEMLSAVAKTGDGENEKSQVVDLSVDVKRLEGILKEREEELTELRSSLDLKENAIQKMVCDHQEVCESLSNDVARKDVELQSLNEQYKDEQALVEELTKELSDLRGSQTQSSECGGLQEKLSELENELNQRTEECSRLESLVEEKSSAAANAEKMLREEQTEREVYERRVASLSRDSEDRAKKLRTLGLESDSDLIQALTLKYEEYSEMEKMLQKKEVECNAIRDKVDFLARSCVRRDESESSDDDAHARMSKDLIQELEQKFKQYSDIGDRLDNEKARCAELNTKISALSVNLKSWEDQLFGLHQKVGSITGKSSPKDEEIDGLLCEEKEYFVRLAKAMDDIMENLKERDQQLVALEAENEVNKDIIQAVLQEAGDFVRLSSQKQAEMDIVTAKCENLTSVVDALAIDVEERDEQVQRLQGLLESKESGGGDYNALEERLSEEKECRKALAKEVESLVSDLQNQDRQIEALEEENEANIEAFEQKLRDCCDLEREIEDLKVLITTRDEAHEHLNLQLEQEKLQSRSLSDEGAARIEGLQKQLKDLQTQVSTKEEVCNSLESQLREEKRHSVDEEAKFETERLLEEHKSRCDTLSNELELLRNKINIQGLELEEEKRERKALQDKHNEHLERDGELERKLLQCTEAEIEKDLLMTDLQDTVARQRQDVRDLNEEVEGLLLENNTISKQFGTLELQLKHSTKKLEEKDRQYRHLEEEVTALKSTTALSKCPESGKEMTLQLLDDSQSHCALLSDELAALKDTLKKREEELVAVRREKESQEQAVKRLKAQIQEQSELEATLDDLKRELRERDRDMQALGFSANDDLVSALRQKYQDQQEQKRLFQESSDHIQLLTNEQESLKHERDTLKLEREALKHHVEQTRQHLATAGFASTKDVLDAIYEKNQTILSMEKQLDSLQHEASTDIQSLLEEHESELNAVQRELEDRDGQVHALGFDSIEQLTQALEKKFQSYSDLEKSLRTKDDRISSLTQDLRDIDVHLDELLGAKKEGNNRELGDIRSDLDVNDSCENRLVELKEKLSLLDEEILSKNKVIDDLTLQLAELTSESENKHGDGWEALPNGPNNPQHVEDDVLVLNEAECGDFMSKIEDLKALVCERDDRIKVLEKEIVSNKRAIRALAKGLEFNVQEKIESDKLVHEQKLQCSKISFKAEHLAKELHERERILESLKVRSNRPMTKNLATMDEIRSLSADEIMELLTMSRVVAEDLEQERERLIMNATNLSIALAESRCKVDELTEQLEHGGGNCFGRSRSRTRRV